MNIPTVSSEDSLNLTDIDSEKDLCEIEEPLQNNTISYINNINISPDHSTQK